MRRIPILLAVNALLIPLGTHAVQEDPAVRRARELVAVINSGQASAISAYADSVFAGQLGSRPRSAHMTFFLGLHGRSGGLEWLRVVESTPPTARVQLRHRRTDDEQILVVQTEESAHHRITGLGNQPASTELGRIQSDADLTDALGRYIDGLVDGDAFSGAVLLARNGEILYSTARGEANKDFGVPNRIDTKFNLGSMNKMFTAVAIAQLVEQGKLSFDDPLSKFIDFPNAQDAARIRLHHLLTHTSGLGNYFNEEFIRSSRDLYRTVDDLMKLAEGDTLAFEPGSRWDYSNTGMLVLGKVVEIASGMDYHDYVRENIARPAGMVNTDAYELDFAQSNLAVGYGKEFDADGSYRYRNNIFTHVMRGGPAGGGYSTVADLLAFAEALKAGKLLSKASVDLLTTAKPELNSPFYGYGFFVDADGFVGHSGGFPGISSNLDIFTDSGYVAVVLSNYGTGAGPVFTKMRALVRARTAPPGA